MKHHKKFLFSIILFQFFNQLHSLTPSKEFNINTGIFEISRNFDPTTRTRRDTSENDSAQNSESDSNSSSDSSTKTSTETPIKVSDGDDAPSTEDVGEKVEIESMKIEIGSMDDVESEAKSVPIKTPSGTKQLTFIRSQFHKAEGHTHAYINWAGKGSKVIFVLTMKKASSYHRSSRNGPATEESFLYRSRNYGKDWYQITKKISGFPETAMLKSYRPSPLKTGCLVFVDDQRLDLGEYTTQTTVLDKIYTHSYPAKGRIVVTKNRGETYESHNLPFAIEEFSFHPTEPDWILAYDKKESQLWASTDLGKFWVQLSDPKTMLVTDKRWFWGVENIDAPVIVHFEYRERGAAKTTYRVYTCNINRCLKPCTNANDDSDNCKLNDYNELLGEISRDSLAVEGTYILVEKSIGQYASGPKHLYTSHKRGNFQKAHFTSNEKFNDYHVINAKDDFIVLGVLHSDMSKSNLYVSNQKGDVFWLTLPNINSNHVKQARFSITTSADPFKVDCVTMPSLVGVLMCNQQDTTMISYTSGTEWLKINKPNQVISYIDPKSDDPMPIKTENKEDSLNLHLSLKFSKSGYYMPKFYSLGDGEYGYAFAHGNYGRTQPARPQNNQHDQTHMGAYMTDDGGVTWHYILEHRHVFTATDFGRIILARESKSFTEFDNADFSMDYGKSFQNVAITDKKIQIDGILTEPGGHTPYFTIFGHPKTTGNGPNESKTDAWHIITVNATEIFEDRECQEKDYETWKFKVPEETSDDLNAIDTPLGMTRSIKKLSNDTFCVNNDKLLEIKKTQEKIANPDCLLHDYTCGYLYNLNQDGECEFDKTLWKTFNDQHDLTWFDEQTERWPMKVPGDECVSDLSWYEEEEFETSNKQHLAGDTGFGRGWDLIVKSHQINKQSLLLTHSCDAQGSNTDMPIGGHITYKVGGKFHKMENTTFKWKKEKFMTPENDDEDGHYTEIKSYEEHGENEWKVTCQSAGMHKISVKMMDKNDNDNVMFEDNVVLNCWSPLNDNFLVFTCVPRVSAGEVVHCRALMTTKEKHGYGLAEDLDSTYIFYNSQLMGPRGTAGISTAGVGKLAAITSFKTPTKNAWVQVAVKNPVCEITRKVELIIGDPDHLPGSVDNKAIQFQLNGFGLNITSVDSVKHADLLLGDINNDMLKDRTISTPNFIKTAFFPTLMQGRSGKFDKDRTMVVVYLTARDDKVEGKNEEFSKFLANFKKLFEGKYLHDGGEFGNADVNGTQAEGSYKITDIMVVTQKEVEQEVINNTPSSVSASASSGWLYIFGVFFCLASVAVAIYFGLNFLVNRNHRTYRQPPQHQDPANLSNSVHNTGNTRNNEMRTLDDSDTAAIIDHEELDNPL